MHRISRTAVAIALVAFIGNPSPAGAGWLDELLGKGKDTASQSSGLTTGQIGAGLKEALEVGTVSMRIR
jgi:hypothetical protein